MQLIIQSTGPYDWPGAGLGGGFIAAGQCSPYYPTAASLSKALPPRKWRPSLWIGAPIPSDARTRAEGTLPDLDAFESRLDFQCVQSSRFSCLCFRCQ